MKLINSTSVPEPPEKRNVRWTTEKRVERRNKVTMRQWFGYCLLGIAVLNTLSVTALIFFCAFNLAALSTTILLTLIGETIAYDTAMFCMVARRLFAD